MEYSIFKLLILTGTKKVKSKTFFSKFVVNNSNFFLILGQITLTDVLKFYQVKVIYLIDQF